MGTSLKGRPRRRAVAHVRSTSSLCWLCGRPIDLGLDRQRHDMASTVDEVITRSNGGSTTDHANLRHAHRFCNSFRQDRDVTPLLLAELDAALVAAGWATPTTTNVTTRSW